MFTDNEKINRADARFMIGLQEERVKKALQEKKTKEMASTIVKYSGVIQAYEETIDEIDYISTKFATEWGDLAENFIEEIDTIDKKYKKLNQSLRRLIDSHLNRTEVRLGGNGDPNA